MDDLQPNVATGQRGPADHVIRAQIIDAADKHFSHYGYGKTTVADLAKAIGFSKAYIYKFFDSKQAIGGAICDRYLTSIVEVVQHAIDEERSSTAKFRAVFKIISDLSSQLFFNERNLYDLTAYSCAENWPCARAYVQTAGEILTGIVVEGRSSGEFERKAPVDEAVRAMLRAFQPFMNPAMLQYNLDAIPEGVTEVTNLFLRSLAP